MKNSVFTADYPELTFTASVPASARKRVESLFYFNPGQEALITQIRKTVEETGAPCIEEREERIWIAVPAGTTQCLFACAPRERPVGVALYGRPTPDVIRILHLAIAPTKGRRKRVERDGIAGALVERIRKIAGRIKGVERVQLPYRASCLRVLW